ncbi:hypothetical protein ACJJTC_016796 [Scirpophaga incertulas]
MTELHANNRLVSRFPMELHFVHVRADLQVQDALASKDGLAILAVFCNVKAEIDDKQQEATAQVMQHLPQLLTKGNRISGILLDMDKLLSSNLQSYYTYAGSLTSPECNEAVLWVIFDTPIYFSDADYRVFSYADVERHNFRRMRPPHGHLVFSPATHITTPHIVQVFHNVVHLVSDFFKNITRSVTLNHRVQNARVRFCSAISLAGLKANIQAKYHIKYPRWTCSHIFVTLQHLEEERLTADEIQLALDESGDENVLVRENDNDNENICDDSRSDNESNATKPTSESDEEQV